MVTPEPKSGQINVKPGGCLWMVAETCACIFLVVLTYAACHRLLERL